MAPTKRGRPPTSPVREGESRKDRSNRKMRERNKAKRTSISATHIQEHVDALSRRRVSYANVPVTEAKRRNASRVTCYAKKKLCKDMRLVISNVKMLRCDSCFKTFLRAGDLFEHIQSACLVYYKNHPQAWAKILATLGNGDNDQIKAATPSTSRIAPERKPGPSTPTTVSKTEVPGSSAQTQSKLPLCITSRIAPERKSVPSTSTTVSKTEVPGTSAQTQSKLPFVCKCEAQYKNLEHFKAHLKVCTPGKEPPFCIMFRAQDANSGKTLEDVHMTVNDYFYGLLTGKQVKMKIINRRWNCYSCGKNLRNNIRFMSHVRHKIINEWEKKGDVDGRNICQHCYRRYKSPFLLQCHLENVHGSVPAACSCRICELHFPSEKNFLFHMKDKHVHNEAPYVCKVCNYRSSFYNDVMKHFRDEHTDTSALLCPFCLAYFFNSSSFLRHVLQHIKKGAECQRCRLMFTSSKERAAHQQLEHTSQVIMEKARKYNNLQKCQIYVRVASFQMTQRQHMMQSSPEQFSLENGFATGSKRAPEDTESSDDTKQGPSPRKKPFVTPTIELPPDLCPLKKSHQMKRIRMPKTRSFPISSLRCIECGDVLQKDSCGIVKHFQNVHECRWCVFVTSCEKASHNHVLKEHADSELREQLLRKSENVNTRFAAELDNDNEDDVSMKLKEEPELPPLPINILSPQPSIPLNSEENLSGTDQSKQAANGSFLITSSTQSKTRRKQSNPTKVYGQHFEKSPSPKKVRRSSDRDFGSHVPDVEVVDDISPPNNKKLDSKVLSKPLRNRKILASDGYFPNIDDDEGWAKYFAETEGITWPGNDKKSFASGTQASDALVPMTTTTSMMPNKSTQHHLFGNSAGHRLLATSVVTPSSLAVSTVQTKLQPNDSILSKNKAMSSPTMVMTSSSSDFRPVFRFQVVPANTVPPSGFNPGPATLRPVMQSRPPMPSSVNRVQIMPSKVPQSPVNLRCLEFTHSSMLIQWDAPVNCAVMQYRVIFQGSGAPTVQILPPEQTLIRLVGLKSDTMYAIRVYTLCSAAVSQYAFLYQRTNKKLRCAPLSGDDIVLVVDDDPASAVSYGGDVVPLPSIKSTCIAQQPTSTSTDTTGSTMSLPLQVESFNDMTKLDSDKVAQPPNAIADLQSDGTIVKSPSDLNKEKSEKKILLDQLLASLKKNKIRKAKAGTVHSNGGGVTFGDNSASVFGDSKGGIAGTQKIDIAASGSSSDAPAESDEGNAKDLGHDVFMVIDSPGSGVANDAARVKSSGLTNDKLESLRKDLDTLESDVSVDATQVCTAGYSSTTPIAPVLARSVQDKLPYVTILQPPSLQRQMSSGSESNDVGIHITSIKSDSTSQEQSNQLNLSDKENIPVETDDSNEFRQSQNSEMEVNIVNVVSLSTPPREKAMEQSGQSIESKNASIVTEAVLDDDKPKSDALTFDAVQILSDVQQRKPEAGVDNANDYIVVEDDDISQTDVTQVSADAVTVAIMGHDKSAVGFGANSDDVAQGTEEIQDSKWLITVPDEAPVDRATDAQDQAEPGLKGDNVGSVVIVLDQDTNKEVVESSVSITAAAKDGESTTDVPKDGLVCEISIDVPVRSPDISETEDSDSSAKPTYLMPQPLQMVVSSTPSRTVIDNTILDGKTGNMVEQETGPKERRMMVLIDNDEMADDAKKPSGEDVDTVIHEEIKILEGKKMPSNGACCGPTLDDIKDIMDSDLSWL